MSRFRQSRRSLKLQKGKKNILEETSRPAVKVLVHCAEFFSRKSPSAAAF